MSQDDVEVVRQLVQAFNRRDLAAMTQWFAPEVEWEPGGPAAVERARYRGREEISSGFASTWETWEVFQVDESEVRDLGDSVVWLGSAHMRGADASHLESSTSRSPSTSWFEGAGSPACVASSAGRKPSKPPGCRSSALDEKRLLRSSMP